jgi:hypothetical protein
MLGHIVFWVHINVSEEHAASIVMVKVKRFRNLMGKQG